ncbi:MAG: adenine phosphoribosyltransferase [Alphaproteobacteria bacterium]|nr:adenine phosphoribosyltransferase [Alphaproteobacteria bacterium]
MSDVLVRALKDTIRDVPDFPQKGIVFKDITPVLASPRLLHDIVTWSAGQFAGEPVDEVVGVESRGFIFGAAVATQLHAGFVPARKPGKLPWDTVSVSYDLEYGSATLELHKDAIRPRDRVVIVDDVLATGGTAAAAVDLVRRLGGEVVACCFVVELGFLGGRDKLDVPVRSLLVY